MKVAHLAVVTPGRCGLYETTRELAHGLRAMGIDSRLVDPGGNPVFKTEADLPAEDRGVPIAPMAWALEADVIVSHSGYETTPLGKTLQPVVHICHGRPLSTYIGERDGGTTIYSYHYRSNLDPRWKAVVTFWPEHVEWHRVMFPDKPVYYVPPSVDLFYWARVSVPEPMTRLAPWGEAGGAINVVIADQWRDDIDPFPALNAFALWARQHPGAKLHLFGRPGQVKGADSVIRRMQDDRTMGLVAGFVSQSTLRAAYYHADFVLTPHQIDVRTVREAMAMGCPVARLAPTGLSFDVPVASREETRRLAEQRFNPARSAVLFRAILEKAIG